MICKDSSRDLMPELRRAGVTFIYSDFHVISYMQVGRCGLSICAAVRVGRSLAPDRKLTQMTLFFFFLKTEKDDRRAVVYSHIIKPI